MNLTKFALAISLHFVLTFSASSSEVPTSALEYQQTTNTRIVVEENFLRFFTGGSERMTIDADGNVGIGAISTEARFEIENAGDHKSDLIVHSKSTVNGYPEWSRIALKRGNDPDEGFLSFYGNSLSGLILGVTGENPILFIIMM